MGKSTYDRLSRWYDALAGPWEAKPRAIGLSLLALREGERVLEVGCGTGQALVEIARTVGDSGCAVGVDLSAGMCAVARSRIEGLGKVEHLHLARGDVLDLPLRDRSFEAVFMSYTLELFNPTEIPRVLGECRRVLRPTGRLCVVALSREAEQGWMSRAYEWCHDQWPDIVDCRPIDARCAVERAGFAISHATTVGMAGLPVEVVLAKPE
jgi:ubiquinone/menaquinone biosynthesis C-methylase UbiE